MRYASLLLAAVPLAAASPHARRGQEHNQLCPHVDAGFPIALAAAQAQRLSTHSWEFGAAVEALLELYNPDLSVFADRPFPNGKIPVVEVDMTAALAYARPTMQTNDTTLVGGDGAAGDPAALGVAALLIGQTEPAYYAAAARQADHLLNVVPRYWNGAISQREDVPELWADFMYMAPPFLAYYAVATHDEALIEEVVRQCGYYRDVLRANISQPYTGLWEHIVGPQSADPGLWSTGNAWAAGGLVRVLATVVHWPGRLSRAAELQLELAGYVKEILDGARGASRAPNGLLRNYINNETWFGEVSGTALLAAVAYRAAILAPTVFDPSYVAWADESRHAVAAHVNASGIGAPAVNPLNWGDREEFTSGSPEGQSFAVLMYAAWRDCVCRGVCAREAPGTTTSTATATASSMASSMASSTGSVSGSASVSSMASSSVSASMTSSVASSASSVDSSSSSATATETASYTAPSPSITPDGGVRAKISFHHW